MGLGVFCVLTLLLAVRALVLLATGQLVALDREYGPRSTDDELSEARKDYGSDISAEPGRAAS